MRRMTRPMARPAATPASVGSTRSWDIGSYSLRRGRALAALGRGEKAGQFVGEGGDAGGDVPVASPGLEQLVGDREPGQDRDLVTLHRRERVTYPFDGGVEVGRDLAGVFRRQLGADRVLLASDGNP